MATVQLILVLSVLTYSVSAVTNLEVATALGSFEKILATQLNDVNQKLAAQKLELTSTNLLLDAANEKLSAQAVELASTNSKLDILQKMIMQNIILTCDTDSCPNKPAPVPAPSPAPAPAPAPAPKPVLTGCGLTDVSSHTPMPWNTACPVNDANSLNPDCWLTYHNVQDTENCLQSLAQEATKGLQGCITKKSGVCSCTLDATLTPDVQKTIGDLKRFSISYKATRASVNDIAYKDSDGRVQFTKGVMEYNCGV